jgi:dihydroorotate dehydrogenase (NAD+) catalytic subunit
VAALKSRLTVDLGGGLRLPTPVMVASGCFGRELAHFIDVSKLGGIVTRSLTVTPSKGSSAPRMAETPSGLLSDTGLQNEGVEAFAARELPALNRIGVPIVVSLAGSSVEEYMRLTMALDGLSGVAALEANACSPSRERDGQWFASTAEGVGEVVGAVSRLTRLPVFVKLSAGVADLPELAEACVRAGAHGLTLVHSFPAMAIDTKAFRPKLASGTGGLSGPALHPIAVRAVYEVTRALPAVPVMGVGGIFTAADAVELLLAGAWAVQVGTALFANPGAAIDVTLGIRSFLEERGLASPADLRGRAWLPQPELAEEPGE